MVGKVIKRTRQFIIAVFSKMEPADQAFVKKNLSLAEQLLFYNMDQAIQKHCVNVALTIRRLLLTNHGLNQVLLTKAALLHDIGKPLGEFGLIHRILYVVAKKLSLPLTSRLAKQSTSNVKGLRHAFYVHVHHAEIGAALARKAGLPDDLIFLIRYHHNKHLHHNKELAFLIKADELN